MFQIVREEKMAEQGAQSKPAGTRSAIAYASFFHNFVMADVT
jgi:hypothetical protein